MDSYVFVRDFVGTVAQAGCQTFIVHARNAILKGLSPKENREIPPLKYEYAYQLKRDFPQLEILINGGIKTHAEITQHLQHVDGVMIGREAYHNPYLLAEADQRYYAAAHSPQQRRAVLAGNGHLRLTSITRHMLGLMAGLPGARSFRRLLSDAKHVNHSAPADVLRDALRF